jgi:hypothetical protein
MGDSWEARGGLRDTHTRTMSAFDCSTKNYALGNRGPWSHDKVDDDDDDGDTILR